MQEEFRPSKVLQFKRERKETPKNPREELNKLINCFEKFTPEITACFYESEKLDIVDFAIFLTDELNIKKIIDDIDGLSKLISENEDTFRLMQEIIPSIFEIKMKFEKVREPASRIIKGEILNNDTRENFFNLCIACFKNMLLLTGMRKIYRSNNDYEKGA